MLTRFLSRSIRAAVPVVAAAALAASWPTPVSKAGEPVDMAQLAPARSFLVLGVPDFAKFRAGFDKSELGALWREPAFARFIEHITEDESKSLGNFLKEFNAQADDLKGPTGAVGIAVFMPSEDQKPRKDEEDPDFEPGPPTPNLLVVADMGENADAWQELIDRVLERAHREKEIATEEDTYGDTKITVIKSAADKNDDGAMDDEPKADSVLGGALNGPLSSWTSLYLARSGTTLSLSTDLKALEAALDALGGKPGDSVADSATFKRASGQLHGGELGYCVVILEPLLKLMRESLADQMPPEAVSAIFDGLGVSGLKALSMGIRMDTGDADSEMSYGVLVPEKKGLISLLSVAAGPFEPPPFASADAAGVSRFSFNFAGLLGVVRDTVGGFPEPQRGQVLGAIDQSSNIAQPALEALGPAIYLVRSFKRPLAHDSEMTIFAIDVKDQVAISNTVSFLAAQAAGMLEPRDFLGNTIYEINGLPMEIAMGVGFGRLFIGNVSAVENAMRLSAAGGQGDAPRLAGEPAFKDAVRAVGNDGIMYSYSDSEQAMRWVYWGIENDVKVYEAMLDDAGIEGDEKAEYLKDYRDNLPEWPKHLPPMETITRHLGNSIMEIRSTPDGFRGRALMLKPARP